MVRLKRRMATSNGSLSLTLIVVIKRGPFILLKIYLYLKSVLVKNSIVYISLVLFCESVLLNLIQ